MHIDVDPELSNWIAVTIRHFEVLAPPEIRGHADWVEKRQALPLVIDWHRTYGLRPDGSLIVWCTDDEGVWTDIEHTGWVRPVTDRGFANGLLLQGARRWSELAPLVPDRSPDDVDCPSCDGEPLPGEILCDRCSGMGWLPGLGATP